jgi:hypothetical protein
MSEQVKLAYMTPEQPAGGTCEVCGGDTPELLARHGVGLKCCFACHGANGTELAAAYGRRLERAAKR